MRATTPNEGVRAVCTSVDLVGLHLGMGEESYFLSAGVHRKQRVVVSNETAGVRFDWPASDLFSVRVGSEPPPIDKTGATGGNEVEP